MMNKNDDEDDDDDVGSNPMKLLTTIIIIMISLSLSSNFCVFLSQFAISNFHFKYYYSNKIII